jgi:hypothetical protein
VFVSVMVIFTLATAAPDESVTAPTKVAFTACPDVRAENPTRLSPTTRITRRALIEDRDTPSSLLITFHPHSLRSHFRTTTVWNWFHKLNEQTAHVKSNLLKTRSPAFRLGCRRFCRNFQGLGCQVAPGPCGCPGECGTSRLDRIARFVGQSKNCHRYPIAYRTHFKTFSFEMVSVGFATSVSARVTQGSTNRPRLGEPTGRERRGRRLGRLYDVLDWQPETGRRFLQ